MEQSVVIQGFLTEHSANLARNTYIHWQNYDPNEWGDHIKNKYLQASNDESDKPCGESNSKSCDNKTFPLDNSDIL